MFGWPGGGQGEEWGFCGLAQQLGQRGAKVTHSCPAAASNHTVICLPVNRGLSSEFWCAGQLLLSGRLLYLHLILYSLVVLGMELNVCHAMGIT